MVPPQKMKINTDSLGYSPTDRRPISSRDSPWASWITDKLIDLGLSPNSISVFGMFAAIVAGVCFSATSGNDEFAQRVLWFSGAFLCQIRLLCNLVDGMVAIKKGIASPVGELYNEVPDRVSDSAVFIGLGFASGGDLHLGYLAALLAVLTAYIRAVGKSLGGANDFCGPMAKPHRMATVTILALYLSVSPWSGRLLIHEVNLALGLICLGSLCTVVRRLRRIAQRLRDRET